MEIVGINKEKVEKISNIKQEDKWVLDYRLDSYVKFCNLEMPSFGPVLDEIDFDKIIYYKNNDNKLENDWDNIDSGIACEFKNSNAPRKDCLRANSLPAVAIVSSIKALEITSLVSLFLLII